MKKNPRRANIGRGHSRVQFGCQRDFLNPIIFKLDEHEVLLLIDYIASQLLLRQATILKQRQTKILCIIFISAE